MAQLAIKSADEPRPFCKEQFEMKYAANCPQGIAKNSIVFYMDRKT
jgi:hypothetical protein